jgi:muramoyltetrapeptide carboxypeptidase
MPIASRLKLDRWSTHRELIKPRALKRGDTVGVFTPSSPGYTWNEGLFTNGLKNLEKLGFKIKLGSVTERRGSQGYRSATAQERAAEFMELIDEDKVHGLISTIGGYNSSSLIPYLDFDKIREARKVICGYSDVTSLHMAIQKFSCLSTIYGPAVMCWFGDWPDGCAKSSEWFIHAVSKHVDGTRKIEQPAQWSNHKRSWDNGEWKTLPRQWQSPKPMAGSKTSLRTA